MLFTVCCEPFSGDYMVLWCLVHDVWMFQRQSVPGRVLHSIEFKKWTKSEKSPHIFFVLPHKYFSFNLCRPIFHYIKNENMYFNLKMESLINLHSVYFKSLRWLSSKTSITIKRQTDYTACVLFTTWWLFESSTLLSFWMEWRLWWCKRQFFFL